jgi:hypothetical protein
MPAPAHLTTTAYAAALAVLIDHDHPVGVRLKHGITGFSDLHDHCDANEYYIDTDAALLVDASELDDDYFRFTGEAADKAFGLFLNPALEQARADRPTA